MQRVDRRVAALGGVGRVLRVWVAGMRRLLEAGAVVILLAIATCVLCLTLWGLVMLFGGGS